METILRFNGPSTDTEFKRKILQVALSRLAVRVNIHEFKDSAFVFTNREILCCMISHCCRPVRITQANGFHSSVKAKRKSALRNIKKVTDTRKPSVTQQLNNEGVNGEWRGGADFKHQQ
jgi:hypothetical protein